jgi:hypothetical protein
VRTVLVLLLLAIPVLAQDNARSADAPDATGRKVGSVTVERTGQPWSADGKTFAPFSVVVRNGAPLKAHFFGEIALDGGKAGDCHWYVLVDPNATKRIEKACKQRREWSDFRVSAKAEVVRVKAAPTPTPPPIVIPE